MLKISGKFEENNERLRSCLPNGQVERRHAFYGLKNWNNFNSNGIK